MRVGMVLLCMHSKTLVVKVWGCFSAQRAAGAHIILRVNFYVDKVFASLPVGDPFAYEHCVLPMNTQSFAYEHNVPKNAQFSLNLFRLCKLRCP